jgi:Tol biopolymer transport system component
MPGQPTRIYLVSRDGGNLQQVTSEERHEADPNWSPDGKSLIFGRLPFLERGAYGPTAIHLVDIESRRISTLPGSEGLFSPHWSPDGRYIEAVSNDGQQMMLFDFQGNKWTEVVKMQVEYPNWSRDGKHVYFCNSRDHGVYRVRVIDRKAEKVTGLENLGGTTSVFVAWCGLAADDSPLVLRDNTTEEIYALDVELP